MNLRLLKLIVRPVYVLDDGRTLTERAGEPFALAEPEIAAFPETWAAKFAALAAEVEGGPDADVD